MKAILVFLLLASLLVTPGCSGTPDPELPSPRAVAGQLDSGDPGESGRLLNLNGEWEMYWERLLTPADFTGAAAAPIPQPTGYLAMPANWDRFTLEGAELPRTGYATFRLRLGVDRPGEVMGLLVPVMYSNYRLWVDDRLVAQSGRVGTNPRESIPEKSSHLVYFQPESGTVQLLLQISNYHNYRGGMWEPIVYGPASAVQASHDRKLGFAALLLGLMFMAGIYHVCLGFFRRKDASTLYFGLFCLIVALRSLMVGDVLLTKVLPHVPFEPAMKVEYICFYLIPPVMAACLRHLYPAEVSAFFVKMNMVPAVLYTILTLLLSADEYYLILMYYQVLTLLAMCWAIFALIRALIRGRTGARYALLGFLVYSAGGLTDLFGFTFGYTELGMNSLGLAAFTLCFSLVLSKKLSLAFNTSEQLAAELARVNDSLDAKVQERTTELVESNGKLEELNRQLKEWSMVDGLTRIYNRRYFDEEYSLQFARHTDSGEALALLLMDIDYFKRYNDAYGHQQGDACLQEVAAVLKAALIPYDGTLARYGGEEFAAVLPRTHLSAALEAADALCAAVRRLRLPHAGSESAGYVTVSVGAAVMVPRPGADPGRLMRAADQQLYEAKHGGRNRSSGMSISAF